MRWEFDMADDPDEIGRAFDGPRVPETYYGQQRANDAVIDLEAIL
jgi:hypothetical protein